MQDSETPSSLKAEETISMKTLKLNRMEYDDMIVLKPRKEYPECGTLLSNKGHWRASEAVGGPKSP